MNQPRDERGRFLSWDGTRNIKYSEKDLKQAFMAGMNSQSRFLTPEKHWQFYRDKINGI